MRWFDGRKLTTENQQERKNRMPVVAIMQVSGSVLKLFRNLDGGKLVTKLIGLPGVLSAEHLQVDLFAKHFQFMERDLQVRVACLRKLDTNLILAEQPLAES